MARFIEIYNLIATDIGGNMYMINNERNNEINNEVSNEINNEVNNEVNSEVNNEMNNEINNEVNNEMNSDINNELDNNKYRFKDKISIVIPIYRIESSLEKCLDSVINQTYKNLEIILVNDGSDDNCPGICDEYAKKDDRVVVIHKENGGLSDARNSGITIARGTYIGFVDGDDWIEADMYETLYSKAILYKADIVTCSNYIVKNNKTHISYKFYDDTLYTGYDALNLLLENRRIQNFAWDKLYKTELFKDIRYPKKYNFEDIATTYKLIAISNRVVSTCDTKYYYVHRPDSISNNNNIKNRYDLYLAHYKRYFDLSSRFPTMKSELYKAVTSLALKTYVYWINEDATIRNKSLSIKQALRISIKGYRKDSCFNKLRVTEKICILFTLTNPLLFEKVVRVFYKSYIKNKITHNMFNMFAGLIDNKYLFTNYSNDNSIYLVGTPEHNNLGDHAIAFAELKYLKDNFPKYNIIEIPEDKVYYCFYSLKRKIKKSDIIILHGGGNIGNQYQVYEDLRRTVIKTFPKNKLIVFPQTIYFSNDDSGSKQLEISKRIYQRHKDLTIIARDKLSYNIMKKHFDKNTILLAPDMVMYIKKTNHKVERNGVLLCFRDDIEGIIEYDEIQIIKKLVAKYYNNVIETDTCLTSNKKIVERNMALDAKWYQFSKAELVITDRLHGMVFAAITETPCICLDNYNHKIEGTYKWIEHLPYIQYLNSLDNLENAIDRLKNLRPNENIYDNAYAIKCFKKLKEVVLPD